MVKGKAPAFQFYVRDWLADPQLRMASHSTKGIWIDLLCFMWEAPEKGLLTGTEIQLAKMVGATEEDFALFLDEAVTLKFANVTLSNKKVTLENRRMVRDQNTREKTRLRVQRYRGNAPSNDEVTPPSSSSSSSSPSKNPPNPPDENYKSFDKYDDKTKDAVVVLIKQVCETHSLTENEIFQWINRSLKQGLRIEAISQGLESVTDNESIEKPIPYMSTVARNETDKIIEEERERLHEQKKAQKPDSGLLDKLGVKGKKV